MEGRARESVSTPASFGDHHKAKGRCRISPAHLQLSMLSNTLQLDAAACTRRTPLLCQPRRLLTLSTHSDALVSLAVHGLSRQQRVQGQWQTSTPSQMAQLRPTNSHLSL